jgi:ABC-2 type transport system permease protein
VIWLVAKREITVRARTKAFRYGLLFTVVLVGVVSFLPKIFGGGSDYTIGLVGQQSDAVQAALVARDTQQDDLTVKIKTYPQESAARAAVAAGDVDAAVVDNARVIAKTVPSQNLSVLLDDVHRAVTTQQNLTTSGLDPAAVERALQVTPLANVSLNGDSADAGARAGIAMVIVVLLFLLLAQTASMLAMGVVEEKGSRIVEILLASLRPWQLLAGKTIGLGVLGLLQIVAIAIIGLLVGQSSGTISDLPDGTYAVVGRAVMWFVLGYAFYAVLYAAIASLVSRQEEVGAVVTPATLLMMAGYFMSFIAAQNPDQTLARVLSMVPPFSAMIMPVRSAVIELPLWDTALAIVLMLIATAGVMWVGGRVYARAVLRTGARVKLREVLSA